MLKKKQKAGEELSEEELEVLHERRERVRKKDQEEVVAAKGGGKGGKAPAAKGKGGPPVKGAPAQEEEGEAPKVAYPVALDHFNDEIASFLEHFDSDRKIVETLGPKGQARKRDDTEKAKIHEDFESARTAETENFNQIAQEREQMKDSRQKVREEAFKDTDGARDGYKQSLTATMEGRNKYRDMIESRKAKESALLDLIGQDKADVGALKSAIE
jgi:hypothetical protein